MKIRLAIVDDDESYVKRLVNNLQISYADKLEIYYFSAFSKLADFMETNAVHVVLVSETIKADISQMSENISFAYLVSNKDIEELDGKPAVCKFQKIDLFYKNVLSLFADTEGRMVLRGRDGSGRLILFTSGQGGAGTSAAAAAFALNRAKAGEKVIYLNLDRFHKSSLCFSGEGNMSFSDVVYAIKSRRANLSIKIESAIKKDVCGVDFFDACRNANDMLELNAQDVEQLLAALKNLDSYQYIVLDIPLDFSPVCRALIENASSEIVLVGDGSEVGNIKLERVLEVLTLMEEKKKGSIFSRTRLLYNRFSSKTGKQMVNLPIDCIGGIHRIEGAGYRELVERLAENGVFEQIGG